MTQSEQPISWSPRSYQKNGVLLMLRQACAGLLFKPGLGKTAVFYMAFRILQEKGFVSKSLVICPIKPMYNVWPQQKDKYLDFKHLRVGVLHGPGKEEVLHDDDYDIYVINPEGLPWLLGVRMETYTTNSGKVKKRPIVDKKRLAYVKQKFQMLGVDESTEFKDSSTNRFQILKHLIPAFRRRYIMTGTPMPHSLMDQFGQIYILDEGDALGRFITHYRTNYFLPDPANPYGWIPQPGALERVAARVKNLVLVVEQKGNIDLPELLINDVYVDLPTDARVRYEAMYEDLVALVASGTVVAANAAVASSKCRQIANGCVYHSEEQGEYTEIHDEKIEALRSLLNELAGDPVLITYEFAFDRDRIADKLGVPCISTGNARKDNEMISKFQRGELPAVMGHPKSISLGIDGLQDNCSTIIMFGVPWNFLHYEQVIDRIKRSGNKSKQVIVHRILARNTVDQKVLRVIDGRDRDQRAFMSILA
jgi:SNF2 family DNA or RNA helicase